ncbi:penicillopepsin [Chaetomium fimeti]|uniref:Penicillopepsin n=1 Tax=Chaetomium fimeti TaxID=1854472 RepID=A0AAE0LM96_9PEZI|nr:penicillopepsin [Chaetomium fimeti]
MSFFFMRFILILLWASSILAAPPLSLGKRSFKIDRVRNPNFKRYDGPKELLKTYQKYRMPIPQDLLNSLDDQLEDDVPSDDAHSETNPQTLDLTHVNTTARPVAAIGSVPATPANGGIEYISPIKIGGQTVNVAFDSGSADLWVFSTQLPTISKIGHQAYDPSLSRTFKPMPGANFSILYGDGTGASGNVGTDTVDVGGAAVAGQAVQMATAVSDAFVTDTHVSGLLGLAFSQLNTVKPVRQRTFFENVMPALAQPLFTVDLRRNTTGAYEFGRIDGSKFVGRLAWVPADTKRGFWQVSSTGFSVGSTTTMLAGAAQAIVDTGTTLMLVSKELSDRYYSHVVGAKRNPAAGGITFPCNATLPDLLVDVGGVYTAKVRGPDINFGTFQGNECFGGIQSTTSHFEIWGDIFFRSQFVVFDGGNHLLGMASHA